MEKKCKSKERSGPVRRTSLAGIVRSGQTFLIGFLIASTLMGGQACKGTKKAKGKAKVDEAKLAKEREERLKREEEENKRLAEERAKKEPARKVERYFESISTAGNVEAANQQIDEALSLFSSPDAPVLIIIRKTGDVVDYDKPTTIRKYFDYLKDQKKTFNKVENITYDENGKIKELILITK